MKLKTKQKYILTAILASSVCMTGCSQPSNDAATSNTTTTVVSAISPTGTIQGVLIDAVTQQPIVGALIDIGLASAVTNQDGQFVLANIPATQIGTGAAQGTTLTGNYEVSINLKNVVYPAGVTTKYPDFSFKQAQVEYTSDVNSPLTGIAKGYQFTVGKLAATIAGVVTDANGKLAPAGYNVKLYSAVNAQNSTTGNTGQGPVVAPGSNSGHIISTTTTDASGKFTFANIEAGVAVMIAAQDTASTLYGERAITAPTENATRTLSFQNGDAVIVRSTDVTAPAVASVTPENFSDITPGATSVVFTFSEPIKQTSVVADVSPSNPNGLYSLVDVNFTGPKPRTGNIQHSLAWSADRKTLTISLPAVGASSMYTVDISRAQAQLKDDADNSVIAIAAPATKYTAQLAVDFSTNGGATAAAPTIAATNSASLNAKKVSPVADAVGVTLNWLPTSGAKYYNVYRTRNQVWGATTIVHETVKLNAAPLLASSYTDASFVSAPLAVPPVVGIDYVENGTVKLSYDYKVTAVNSDGIESAASNTVAASDVVAPSLVAGAAVTCPATAATTCDVTGKITSISVPFDEVMDETTVNTVANYTSTIATFSSAAYTGNSVKLTLATPIATTAVPFGYISTGPNGLANSVAAVGDTQVIAVGSGQPNTTCVTAGVDGVLQTAVMVGDDAVQGVGAAAVVSSGANGICQTAIAVASDDVQAIAVGNGQANTVAVSAGADGVVATVFAGDDTNVAAGIVVTVANVKDVAANLIGAASGSAKSKYNADGTVQ